MKLRTEASKDVSVMTFDHVRRALANLHEDGNSFAVLSRDDGHFIQTAVSDSGMVVEKQEGGLDRHFQAKRNGSTEFASREVEQLFEAFYNRAPAPAGVAWERIEINTTSALMVWFLKLLPWIAGLALILFFIRDIMRLVR